MILAIFIISVLATFVSAKDLFNGKPTDYTLWASVNVLSACHYFTSPAVWISLLSGYFLILVIRYFQDRL